MVSDYQRRGDDRTGYVSHGIRYRAADTITGCLEDGDPNGPFALVKTIAKMAIRKKPGDFFKKTGSCLGGEIVYDSQMKAAGNSIGRLYGANIIEEWTEDVTRLVSDLPSGERAVEVYWNASTWNPYQVVLFKTQLRR